MTLDDEGRNAPGREVVRFIPVPASVSEQAQQFLGIDMFGGGARRLVPTDVAGWRTLIKETDELLVAVIGAQVDHLRSSVQSTSVGGVPIFVVTPEGVDEGDTQPIYLDIHGGSLVMGSGKACEVMARRMAAQVGMQTWSVDYRMPPDHPYPAALDDVLAVYRGLVDVRAPGQIVVGGGSAGGNLAAALMLRARDAGLPLPVALILLTPEVDLTESGDSFQTNLGIDCVLTESLADSIALYMPVTMIYDTPICRHCSVTSQPPSHPLFCKPERETCSCPTPFGCTGSFVRAASRPNYTYSRPCPTAGSSVRLRTTS